MIFLFLHESTRVLCEPDKWVNMIISSTSAAISNMKYVGDFNLSDKVEW